jgi:hypothetical protein
MHATYLSRIERFGALRIDKQNILWLKIRMRELVVMEKFHGIAELIRHVTNLINWIWLVVVVFQKIEHA